MELGWSAAGWSHQPQRDAPVTSTMRLMVCATRIKKVSTSWKSWLKRPRCWGGAISLQKASPTCEVPNNSKPLSEQADGLNPN